MTTKYFSLLFGGLLLIAGITMTGCSSEPETAVEQDKPIETPENQTVSSDSLKLEMELPGGMEATTQLAQGIPFQYQDGIAELYITGNSESAIDSRLGMHVMGQYDEEKTLTENYLNFTLNLMKKSKNELSNESELHPITIDGEKGMWMSVDGKLPNIAAPIAYWLCCFEHEGSIYKFIFWTLKSKKEDVESTATRAFTSIRFK